MSLAFDWVKHNVVDYGGDSSSVTLVGHSVGAQIALLALLRTPDDFKFQNFFGWSGRGRGIGRDWCNSMVEF